MSKNNQNNGDAFKAGLAGAVVGAVAGAAAVYLSDEEKRQQLINKGKEAVDVAKGHLEEKAGQVREGLKTTADRVKQGAGEADAAADRAKEELEETEE